MQLTGEQLRAATGEIIWSIYYMRTYEGAPGRPFDQNALRSGIDTTARNFVVDGNRPPVSRSALVRGDDGNLLPRAGTPVLVDHHPAYRRYGDGLFHVGHDPDDVAFCERAYGTRTGAIATLLFTGLYVTQHRGSLGHFDEPTFYREWQGLVPRELHDQVREDLRWYADWYIRSLGHVAAQPTVEAPNV